MKYDARMVFVVSAADRETAIENTEILREEIVRTLGIPVDALRVEEVVESNPHRDDV